MIRFTPIKLSDKSWVDEIVMSENSPSADYNFGNIYIWDKHFKQLTARCGDRMLTKLRYDGKPTFVFPIGSGELRPAIEALREFAAWRGYPFCLRGITEQHREMLEAEYPGRFDYTEDVNNADYIYLAEKLIEERQAARKAKNFARADEIRNELLEKGITLLDTREGVKWKRA